MQSDKPGIAYPTTANELLPVVRAMRAALLTLIHGAMQDKRRRAVTIADLVEAGVLTEEQAARLVEK